jgi:putative tryptophan/tyrosine transport system substrate-binding protein
MRLSQPLRPTVFDALFVGIGPFFAVRRIQLANLASRRAVRATLPDAGLCRSRRVDELRGIVDTHRQVGVYAGRILGRTKPADLPVVQASKFELVINAEKIYRRGCRLRAPWVLGAFQVGFCLPVVPTGDNE